MRFSSYYLPEKQSAGLLEGSLLAKGLINFKSLTLLWLNPSFVISLWLMPKSFTCQEQTFLTKKRLNERNVSIPVDFTAFQSFSNHGWFSDCFANVLKIFPAKLTDWLEKCLEQRPKL